MFVVGHMLHASCPWGPATAHGVGTLTEMDVIYMERSIYMPKFRSIGLLAAAGEVVTHERTEGITDHYYGFHWHADIRDMPRTDCYLTLDSFKNNQLNSLRPPRF